MISTSRSAERESKSLRARIEKLDFELSIGDRRRLSDQLIQPLLGHRADALFVDVESMRRSWRLSVDRNAKLHRRSRRRRTHNKMKIARVKAVHDAAVGLVQFGSVAFYRPVAGQRPTVRP